MNTEKLTLELLKLAFELKTKGHDLFVEYSPHVNIVRVRLYKNGWDIDREEPDLEESYYIDRTKSEVIKGIINAVKGEVK